MVPPSRPASPKPSTRDDHRSNDHGARARWPGSVQVAVVDHPPPAEHHGPVDQGRQRPGLVQHDQDCSALGQQGVQQPGQHLLVFQIDAGGRFVEDEQFRGAGQGAGDQRPLMLAAGQMGHVVAGPIAQTDQLERPAYGPVVGVPGRHERSPLGQPSGGDHLADLGARQGTRGPLGYVADPRPRPELLAAAYRRSRPSPAGAGPARAAARTRVDLPEPLPPIKATASPDRTARSMPRSTGSPPSSTDRSRASSTVAPVIGNRWLSGGRRDWPA